MWEVSLGIRHTGCPISDTSAATPGVIAQHLSKVERDGQASKRLLYLYGDGGAIDEFAATFRDREAVETFEPMAVMDGGALAYYTTVIRYDGDNPSILGLVTEQGCHHHPTVTIHRGIERWILYTATKATIQELIDDVERHGNAIETYRSVEITESVSVLDGVTTLLTKLTERQRTVYETALRLGYYDHESGTTMEDIAAALDIHPTTAWEHLTKVENAVLQGIGERFFSHG